MYLQPNGETYMRQDSDINYLKQSLRDRRRMGHSASYLYRFKRLCVVSVASTNSHDASRLRSQMYVTRAVDAE